MDFEPEKLAEGFFSFDPLATVTLFPGEQPDEHSRLARRDKDPMRSIFARQWKGNSAVSTEVWL
jgi:hypothetical protein